MAIHEPHKLTKSADTDSEFSLPPTVLLVTTSRWYPTARLAMALANHGWVVEMLCPSGHPVVKTKAVRRTHRYHGLAPLRSLAVAIAEAKPDLIIPGDDLATGHMHRLYELERKNRKKDSPICRLIERSLGPAESFPVAYTRAAFIELAQKEGVRVPRTEAIANLNDLQDWVVRNGFPAVLKANGTSGGEGVRVVRTVEEAEHAFRALQAPPRFLRAAKHAVVDDDLTLLWPSLMRHRFVVNAQAFVEGRESTSAVACWNGKVLAALHFEVINKRSSSGPATVVRQIENAEMSDATEKMVRRLHLSGVHGFDFMLEEHTGYAYLIEINPRATQVGHLALGPGRDIPAALYAALSGNAVPSTAKVTEKDTIALFPQEWTRDPASSYLQSAYHDIPWEEPELVRDCVNSRRKQSAWYSRVARKQVSALVRLRKPVAVPAGTCATELDLKGKSR